MFDSLVPDTIPPSVVVTLAIVWLTAFVSLALTAFLARILRRRFSFAMLCVMGIGTAPLIIYFSIFTPFYVYGASQIAVKPIWGSHVFQIATIPFWTSFRIMAYYIAPNYLLSFVIAGVFLIAWRIRKSIEEGAAVVFVILLPVHGLGLYWAYLLLTHKGSF